MKSKKIVSIGIVFFIGIVSATIFTFELTSTKDSRNQIKENEIELIKKSGLLFDVFIDPTDLSVVNGKVELSKAEFGLKEDFEKTYDEIGVFQNKENAVFIIPTFTSSAYAKNGFYDFFKEICDERCLTTNIIHSPELDYNSSANGVKILKLLGYPSISDLELHNDPDILKKFDKVIVLHNEYVSKTMFDAITMHENVIFLYPNALYGEIKLDEKKEHITLIRGHGYPNSDIRNGFDWENENTHPYEFDNKCENWSFYEISNGFMLNCYPEQIIWQDKLFLKALNDL